MKKANNYTLFYSAAPVFIVNWIVLTVIKMHKRGGRLLMPFSQVWQWVTQSFTKDEAPDTSQTVSSKKEGLKTDIVPSIVH